LLLASATAGVAGCGGWRRQAVSPVDVLADPGIQVIQVTRGDSSLVEVHQPRIVGDTLTGLASERAIQRVSIPVADITAVATRRTDFGKTLLAGVAIVGGVAAYALLQSLNTTP
jgi:hypothetical protein